MAEHDQQMAAGKRAMRILYALCRQAGGELRLKAEILEWAETNVIRMSTEWDAPTQEWVYKVPMGTRVEMWRVSPDDHSRPDVAVADPIKPNGKAQQEELFPKKGSTLDDAKLASMEQTLQKRRIASMLRDELASRKVTESNSG